MLTVSLIWEKLFIQFHAISYPIPSLFLFAWCAPLLTRIGISELSRVCAVKRVDFPNRRDNSSAVTPPRKNSTRTHTHAHAVGGTTGETAGRRERNHPASASHRIATNPRARLRVSLVRRPSCHSTRRDAYLIAPAALRLPAKSLQSQYAQTSETNLVINQYKGNNHNLKSS